MKALATAMMVTVVAMLAMNASAGETKWWDSEYNGDVAPASATPAWGGASGSLQTEGSTDFWHNVSTSIWNGPNLAAPAWDSATNPTTMEVRFRVHGDVSSGDDVHIRNVQPKEWSCRIENDPAGDIMYFRQSPTNAAIVTADPEWNILRVLYQTNGVASAYVLSGGDMAYDQGWWTADTLVPVTTNWQGFGAGTVPNTFGIQGQVDIDYVRWAFDGLYAPEGVPEPTSLVLLGIGAALLARRRRG